MNGELSPEEQVFEDLLSLARAERLCDWMFEQFADRPAGRVVEIGAGIGTFSQRLLAARTDELLLIEPEPACAAVLARTFGDDDRVTIVEDELPRAPSLAEAPDPFDFALCQNVLEHIEDDAGALRAIAAALRPGGELGLLVPAHPRLYGRLDHSYGHHRRYTRAGLRRVVAESGLDVIDLYSFNLLGIPGWWVQNRRSARAGGVTPGQLRAYESLLRLWRPVERRVRPPAGLSLIARARRPG